MEKNEMSDSDREKPSEAEMQKRETGKTDSFEQA